MRRVFISLIAVLSAVLLAGTTVPVDAATQRALPERNISIDFAQTGSAGGKAIVRIFGKAQELKGKTVYLQKKNGTKWPVIAKVRTNSKSKYNFKGIRIGKGIHKFRVRAPKAGGFKLSYSNVMGIRVY